MPPAVPVPRAAAFSAADGGNLPVSHVLVLGLSSTTTKPLVLTPLPGVGEGTKPGGSGGIGSPGFWPGAPTGPGLPATPGIRGAVGFPVIALPIAHAVGLAPGRKPGFCW